MLRDLDGTPYTPLGWLDASRTWIVMRRAGDTQDMAVSTANTRTDGGREEFRSVLRYHPRPKHASTGSPTVTV